MSKKARPVKRPEITFDQNAFTPLYKQLYERLRLEILAGQLEIGTRLPSTRGLASELGISRNTVALAYEMLLLEGYIESRVGDGTRVADLQPEQLFQDGGYRAGQSPPASSMPSERVLARRGELLLRESAAEEFATSRGDTGTHVFRIGQPDVSSFPYQVWASLVAKHARHSLRTVSFYQDAQGYAPLRQAIATHIGITRGVHCTPEQVILTAGAQGALDLIARVLLNPDDPAWVEDPGYAGARGALLAAGARLVAVPVDREGIEVESGRRLCPEARLAIVTPSHQFPTGVTMSLNRRLTLLEWAREARAWIVEDDYDSEYRFSGRPLEALQGLDNGRRVIYVGTFSKVLFPSLRLGYLVAPNEIREGLLAMRRAVDMHLPLLEQMALAGFMAEGQFARHLRKMRGLYRERRDALVEALQQELGGRVEITIPEAGMHLVVWLPQGVNAQEIARQASMCGLHILAVSQCSLRPLQRDGLLFGFACASPEELRVGVKILAQILGKK